MFRYVSEIAEGSKILQDQLALMDERYLELRTRLESSRKQFQTQMARIQKESSELRVKYSMATHGKLLDTIPLPSQSDMNLMASGMDPFRGSIDTGELLNMQGSGKRGGKPRATSAHAATSLSRNFSGNSFGFNNTHSSSPHSGGDNHREAWADGTGNTQKDKAQRMFAQGIMHNQRFAPSLSPAEAEAKEKHIIKKITGKQKKCDRDGWTDERLQELIKS